MPLPLKKLIPGILLALIFSALAAQPLWWSTANPPVIDPAASVNNRGPANIGQAKHLAKSALDALRPILPDVANAIEADLATIVDLTVPDPKPGGWSEQQKAPLLIGQLKAIADPFYTHLHTAAPQWLEAERITNRTNHPGSIFPWTSATSDDNNKGMANIGQLKAVFSLRFDQIEGFQPDSDHDGLPDEWEIAHGLDPNNPSDVGQPFQNGPATNLAAYQAGVQANPNATLADHDGDFRNNEDDVDPNDTDLNWQRAGEASYVLIDLDIPSTAGQARDINDKGEVLFDTGIWSGGEWIPIEAEPYQGIRPGPGENNDSNYEVNASNWMFFNDARQLTGYAELGYSGGPHNGQIGSVLQWTQGDSYSRHAPSALPFFDYNDGEASPIGISDDGTVFSRFDYVAMDGPEPVPTARILVTAANGTHQGLLSGQDGWHPIGSHGHSDVSGNGWLATNTASELYSAANHRLSLWNPSQTLVSLPAQANGFFFPLHLADLDEGQLLIAAGTQSGIDSEVFLSESGTAKHLPSLSGKSVRLFAGDGTGMTSDGKLWRNGELIPMRDICQRWAELEDDEWTLQPLKANKHGVYLIQAINPDEVEPRYLLDFPVSLISDMNNDGDINPKDNELRDAAFQAGVTDEVIDMGTEFVFVNDNISNGLGDFEDKNAPAGTVDDDDVQEIKVGVAVEFGLVSFDHPAIERLRFFEDKSCKIAVQFPFNLAVKDLPERIYIRTEGDFDGQVEGDLVLKYKMKIDAAEIDALKFKLAIVHRVGDAKYFHAGRDYMGELNSSICVRVETIEWISSRGNNVKSDKKIVMMIHENTKMKSVETFHTNPQLWGVGAVVVAHPGYDVVVNGNFCFKSRLRRYPLPNGMTEMCHGRLISGAANSPASATGGDSPFESVHADYIGFTVAGGINIKTGIVPLGTYQEALGGFASKLENYGDHPWYGIGQVGSKKVFFVATPTNDGAGGGLNFKQQLMNSGVPALPGGQPGEIQCVAGDGGSSVALAYKIDGVPLKVFSAGSKHYKTPVTEFLQSGAYFINTYIAFESQKSR